MAIHVQSLSRAEKPAAAPDRLRAEKRVELLARRLAKGLQPHVLKAGQELLDIRVRIIGSKVEFHLPEEMSPAGLSPDTEGKPPATGFDPAEAGRKVVVQLQQAEGGSWSGEELLKRFQLTPATLHKRRKEYRIVAWRDAKNEFHYPKWQFNGAGALWPGLQAVLQTFRSPDEWRVMRYFLSPKQQLDNNRPLDLLRSGEVAKVIAHARTHGQEDRW